MPQVSIYQAINRPTSLIVSCIPNFYDHAQEIDTCHLDEIRDLDDERMDTGECVNMIKFLKRCDNLESLSISVLHQDTFSWAIPEPHGSIDHRSPQKYLKRLR
ncbi:hypothetical protein BGZ76_008023, partial [Entomortierella beljakovae]